MKLTDLNAEFEWWTLRGKEMDIVKRDLGERETKQTQNV